MTTSGENLYNLIPRPEEKYERPERHLSKFHGGVVQEYKSNKHGHKTMGEAKVPPPKTDEFLKRHSKEPKRTSNDEEYHYPCDTRKPAVPKCNERPLMGVKTKKNFIQQNAAENIMSVSKKPQKAYIDTRKGDRFALEPSGLEPVFIKKRDFGKVPDYLVERKYELTRAQEEYDAYCREMQERGAMYKLSEAERQEIISGLKQNWEELHKAYQSLGVMVDTIPKMNRKEWLENQMKTIERDIETMERHGHIYVAN